MKKRSRITWALATTVMLGMALPSMAQQQQLRGPERNDDNKAAASIHVTIKTDNDRDDMKVYQQWYGNQIRGYDAIDADTGARLSDLLQIVTDVSGNRLTVVDQANHARVVQVNSRTQIVQNISADRQGTMDFRGNRSTYPNVSLERILDPGDLVVVQGYLFVTGDMMATSIKRVGHARGFGDRYDDDRYMGHRAWGDVRSVDTRRNIVEINTDDGRRRVLVDRHTDIIINGRDGSLYSIRPGDRVVFYYDRPNLDMTITATRIVELRTNDRYPDGDHGYWCDPGRNHDRDDDGYGRDRDRDRDRDNDRVNVGPFIEGRLQYISNGIFFNTMVIRGMDGRTTNVYYAKNTQAVNDRGERIAITDLRDNQRVRVTYMQIGDSMYAERVAIDN